jgi:uncharacterized protein YndB with AHSA1/START domain
MAVMPAGERAPVVRRVRIAASRDDVWRALTRRDLLSEWLGEVIELDATAGGAIVVRDPDGATRRGLVELIEPERKLIFRWRRLAGSGPGLEVGEATRVAFELEDDASGTRLTVTEEPTPMVAMGRRS